MQAYIIGLSINEDLKLEKEKEKKSSAARYFIQSSRYITAIYGNLWQFTSTIILPPLRKSLPLGFIVYIIPIGRSYPYIFFVAYYLYYTSTLSINLGTLGVLVY